LEPVVSGIFVWLIIIKNIVTINRPSSANPGHQSLVEQCSLRELIIKVMLSWDFELCVLGKAMIKVMMFVTMSMMIVMMTVAFFSVTMRGMSTSSASH
jgi:hypothetical protein